LTDVVVDASATVEILLNTPDGQSLARQQVPQQAIDWVPDIYFAEVAGALRRAELTQHLTTTAANHYPLASSWPPRCTEQLSSRCYRKAGGAVGT